MIQTAGRADTDLTPLTSSTIPIRSSIALVRRLPRPRHADGFIEQMVAWVADRAAGPPA